MDYIFLYYFYEKNTNVKLCLLLVVKVVYNTSIIIFILFKFYWHLIEIKALVSIGNECVHFYRFSKIIIYLLIYYTNNYKSYIMGSSATSL